MEAPDRRPWGFLGSLLHYRETSVFAAMIVFWLAFGLVSREMFSWDALVNVLSHASHLGIVAVGVAFLMIAGEFDLSVGSLYALTAIVYIMLVNRGLPEPAALAAITGIALAVGAANAALTVKARIPSFIATLGMMWFLRMIIYIITGGYATRLEDHVHIEIVRFLYVDLGGGLPSAVIVLVVVAVVFHLVLASTAFGNRLQAVGGAPGVARALGISVPKVKLAAFLVAALLAELAGLTHVARFHSVEATTGRSIPLEAIAASVIGGCSLYGGVGTIAGAALGAVVISEVNTGLVLAGVPGTWYVGFIGLLLIVAAVINEVLASRRR